MLPRIKISYLSGQLGTVAESPDGLLAIACGAVAVSSTFLLGTPYSVYNMSGVEKLGITASVNPALYRHARAFYDEAPEGTRLILYGMEKAKKFAEVCDYTNGALRSLITTMGGALRGILVAREDTVKPTVTEGLDPDVFTALPKAQQLAEWATTTLYAPLFIVIEGRAYSGTKLKDLSPLSYNRVGVFIGDTTPNSPNAAIGTLAGRIATTPVHRNIGRVKDGVLFPTTLYIGAEKVNDASATVSDIYDKGYITPRCYVGRSGYFFADDRLACLPTDDYAHLTHRRMVDKAARIAYNTLLDMMLDELEVNTDGTLQVAVVKAWQQTVENAVNRSMTANGELSAVDGSGCECYINEKQNVVSTSRIAVSLRIRPFGYARYIDVDLGFNVKTD